MKKQLLLSALLLMAASFTASAQSSKPINPNRDIQAEIKKMARLSGSTVLRNGTFNVPSNNSNDKATTDNKAVEKDVVAIRDEKPANSLLAYIKQLLAR